MEKEMINVVCEDENEVLIEGIDYMLPDTEEFKKLGLVLVGIFTVGGVTFYLCRKIKLGTKIKNGASKVVNGVKNFKPFGKKKEAPEAEATESTEE